MSISIPRLERSGASGLGRGARLDLKFLPGSASLERSIEPSKPNRRDVLERQALGIQAIPDWLTPPANQPELLQSSAKCRDRSGAKSTDFCGRPQGGFYERPPRARARSRGTSRHGKHSCESDFEKNGNSWGYGLVVDGSRVARYFSKMSAATRVLPKRHPEF